MSEVYPSDPPPAPTRFVPSEPGFYWMKDTAGLLRIVELTPMEGGNDFFVWFAGCVDSDSVSYLEILKVQWAGPIAPPIGFR